jgi:N-glycosylase/DNA lyase
LREKLKSLGYRFYNRRSEYIVEAREKINLLKEILKEKRKERLRDMLVKNFKGIGYKEASHFLRNLGYKDFAILDRHVLKTLKKYKVIEEIPKTLTKKKYLEIEEKLRKISKKLNISLAELDFYLFYLSSKSFPIK